MATNTIVAWAHVRSRSTAFEKSMQQRDDTTTLHEPYNDCFYFGSQRCSSEYGERPELEHYGPDQVLQKMIECGEQSSLVFVKEMAFMALPYMADAILEGWTNTFIIRRPEDAVASLFNIKPDFHETALGYRALGELYRRTRYLEMPAVVIESDRLAHDPETVLRKFCTAVGVEFQDSMLHWKTGPVEKGMQDDVLSHARWHKVVDSSTGFILPRASADFRSILMKLNTYQLAALQGAQRVYEEMAREAL